ncbi:MAG TPA: hypothetical protein VJ742_05665, partial [Nitrososphaera sp.]|nr:hypothetical protein [Nitrososphaera sp.]
VNDFKSYMSVHYAPDPLEKRRARKLDSMREEVLQALTQHQHHDYVRELLLDYQDKTLDYNNLLLFNIQALRDLMDREKQLQKGYSRLSQYNNAAAVREEVKTAFEEKLVDVRVRQKAVIESINQLWKEISIDPSKGYLKETLKSIEERKNRFRMPPEVVDLLAGRPSERLTSLALQEKLAAWKDMESVATQLLSAIMELNTMPGSPEPDLLNDLMSLLIDIAEFMNFMKSNTQVEEELEELLN